MSRITKGFPVCSSSFAARSRMTRLLPSSAACDIGISWSYHGVMTMRSDPSSVLPAAPGTRKPTLSTRRTLQTIGDWAPYV